MENFKMTTLQITLTIDTETEDTYMEILNDITRLISEEHFFICSLQECLDDQLKGNTPLAKELRSLAKGRKKD